MSKNSLHSKRLSLSQNTRSKSVSQGRATSALGGGGLDSKKKSVSIWPEWNDTEISNEKWDIHTKPKGDNKQGKSPVALTSTYDDPEGRIEMPPSLSQRITQWKRPRDFITDKNPVVVDPEGMQDFVLTAANGIAFDSELMRHVASSIMAVWNQSLRKPPPDAIDWGKTPSDLAALQDSDYTHSWRPWEHIYSCKPGKGPNLPVWNPVGKYVVKLRFMGCWRKIIVDDTMPFDERDNLLLPQTGRSHELWPMILCKALIKIASLDYGGGGTNSSCEFGEFSVIQCLTGWLPEVIPLQYGHTKEIWEILKSLLPEFKLPDPPPDEDELAKREEQAKEEREKAEREAKEKEKLAEGKGEGKGGKDGKEKSKEKDKGRDEKKDKKGDKDKDKDKSNKDKQSTVPEDQPMPENPEVMIFASYMGLPKTPVPISKLAEMADASEKLRQHRLSHMYPHPVHILQTRSCPLEPPPPPEKVPAWKLIRPRKKQPLPTDQPADPVSEVPIQCLEIASPFVDYRVSAMPIPSDIHRPKSILERGTTHTASRPVTASQVKSIVESDENKPEPEPVLIPKVDPKPIEVKQEEPVVERSPSRDKSRRISKDKKKNEKDEIDKKSSPLPRSKSPKRTSSPKRVSSAARDRQESKVGDIKAKSDTTKDSKSLSIVSSLDAQNAAAAAQQGTLQPSGSATSTDTHVDQTNQESSPTDGDSHFTGISKSLWFGYNEFVRCFRSLIIYHKPRTYPSYAEYSDLKVGESHQGIAQQSKVAASRGGAATTTATTPTDEKAPHYLFVDSLKPIEIVVSFSALCRWNEGVAIKEDSRMSVTNKSKGVQQMMQAATMENKAGEPGTPESNSIADAGDLLGHDQVVQRGSLIAEPHSWKSLVIGQPKLRLHTSSSKAALLKLPEGRHVLRFYVSAPLGYHVELCSSTPFVFGEEEKIMAELVKESCLFVNSASRIMSTLIKCIQGFSDPQVMQQRYQEFYMAHCPYYADKTASKQHHFRVFYDAFFSMLKKVLSETSPSLLTPEMAFAWRAFFFDCTTKNILGLSYGAPSRPTTAGAASDRASAGPPKKGKKQSVAQDPPPGEPTEPRLEYWKNRIPEQREHDAATKIQKIFRGFWVRHIKNTRFPGTEDSMKYQKVLQNAAAALEPSAEQHGLLVLRSMFKTDPSLMAKYPFHRDEWSKISYADYQGAYPEHPANSWFLIFRDIFYVEEEMLCVPKLYTSIPTCFIRVVNNDTGEEVKKIFMRVAPAVYKKNKYGYTFLAEARTTDTPLPIGKWRMRLIGSLDPLPSPTKTEINSSFSTKELHDYYIPNDKNIITRTIVKVSEDSLASIQISTSKPDVFLRLSILDRDEEILSTLGKGHAVLPAFIFRKDVGGDENEGLTRRASRPTKKTVLSQTIAKKRTGSPGHKSRSGSRTSSVSVEDEDDRDVRPHKYVIQCIVQRDSWPLSPSQWAHVAMLKEQEKNDLKFTNKERPVSGVKSEKPAATPAASTAAKSKDKPGKGKGKEKDKDKSNSPTPSPFDYTKAHFVMRVIVDGNSSDAVEIKKDTERIDELKAMKRAWEEAEPGRMAKAWQSRMKYLNSHMIKVKSDDETDTGPTAVLQTDVDGNAAADIGDSEAVLTLEPPRPPSPKEVLAPLDLTPYIRHTGVVRLLDEEEEQRQLEEKRREIEEWRARREEIEQWRIAERQQRNKIKIEQIQLFERMQERAEQIRAAVDSQWQTYRRLHHQHAANALENSSSFSESEQGGSRCSKSVNQPSPRGRSTALSRSRTPAP